MFLNLLNPMMHILHRVPHTISDDTYTASRLTLALSVSYVSLKTFNLSCFYTQYMSELSLWLETCYIQ